jgi:predicted LPLAT superfamily acyltransferase
VTPARWHELPERGTALGIRAVVAALRLLGRRGAGWLLGILAAWYVLFHPHLRRVSRAYLRRVGSRARLRDVLRHVLTFAQVTADRVFLVSGEVDRFRIFREGGEELGVHLAAGRGVVLLLAHLGSWEVLRIHSREYQLRVSVLAYYENSRGVTDALRELDPSVEGQLIEIRPGDPSFVFEVEDRIRRGEVVGTMGDRVGLDGKSVRVPFLGAEASLPTGPYLLASALRCPVFLAFGLYEAPDRYRVVYEPFADRVVLPRGPARAAALRELASRYAARLEHHCRAHPENWFNFYDFWRSA